MDQSHSIPWKRLSIEAMAIVASILFAFAIDAWWDDNQTDRKTQEILNAVRLEMESNLSSLQDSISHHDSIVEAIQKALDQRSAAGLLPVAVIDVEVFEPNTGAIDTLVATGMLGEVDDPELQILLGAFSGFATDLRERESRAVEFRDAARRRVAAIGDPVWVADDRNRVLADVHMLNLLAMRSAEERDAIESGRRLEQHLVELLSRLDSRR